jgi:putative MATE family efflux protein
MTIGLADILMMSAVGEYAVSGVSLVDAINILVINIFSALATGGAVVSSQYIGRRDMASAGRSARQLVYITLLASFGFTAGALLLRRPLLYLIYGNIPPEVMGAAAIYFLITSLSYPFIALYNACAAIFRSTGNSRAPMFTTLVMNIIHIALNVALIFGLEMGAAGAAWSTLFSRIAAAVALYLPLLSRRSGLISLKGISRIQIEPFLIRAILKIGIPTGIESSLFQLGKIMIARIFTAFGTAAIAANAVTNSLTSLGYMPGNAYCFGLLTIVGQCVGAGDYPLAKRQTGKLIGIGYLSYLLVNSLTVLFIDPLIGFFQLSLEAQALARSFLLVNCVSSMLFWPPSFILPNGLKAAGDAAYVMVVAILSMWFVRVAFSYVLVYPLGLGPVGVWFGMGADFMCRSAFYSARWFSGTWQRKSVIG